MATLTLNTPGTVLGSVALTTTEAAVDFVGGGQALVEMICDVDWEYRSASGGTSYTVPASTPFQLKSRPFYAILAAGTGTLRVLQVG